MVKKKNIGAEFLHSDSQKTHYWISSHKVRKIDVSKDDKQPHDKKLDKQKCVFKRLLDGKEAEDAVLARYQKFLDTWKLQRNRMENIMEDANITTFSRIIGFINSELKFSQENNCSVIKSLYKLPVGFLLLGSNIANNTRVLEEFSKHVESSRLSNIKLVNLNSNNCANIKSTLREVVKQVIKRRGTQDISEIQEHESTREDPKTDVLSDEDSTDAEDEDDYEGRINYDFDIVQNWCDRYFAKEKTTFRTSQLKLIIIIENCDSLNNQVLNHFLKIIYSYSKMLPIKVIMGLSTSDVDDWINNNLSNELKISIESTKLEVIDNSNLGINLLDDVFFTYEVSEKNILMMDNYFAAIILSRFKNSNNSIDILISELKLSYMIYFYQQPLANLLQRDFKIGKLYVNILRKLPSFKIHIETLLHKYRSSENTVDQQCSRRDQECLKNKIIDLLNDDHSVVLLFKESYNNFCGYKITVLNLLNIIDYLYSFLFNHRKEKLEIYKVITSGELMTSEIMQEILFSFNSKDVKLKQFINSGSLRESVDFAKDNYLSVLKSKLEVCASISEHKKAFLDYASTVNHNIKLKISDQLFYEVFSLDGGKFINSNITIEESYQNLMINLVRPNLRTSLESSIEEPRIYLNKDKLNSETNHPLPIISQLFQVYKDAPATINIYDFFIAFKESLDKEQMIHYLLDKKPQAYLAEKLHNCLDDNSQQWDQLVYSWFLHSCLEMINMGFLKEKSKSDYFEKSIWTKL